MSLATPVRKGIRPVKHMGEWWRWALVSPDGVAPTQMVGVSASVNLPLHHKVQRFSSGTGSPGWSRKKGHKTVAAFLIAINSLTKHLIQTEKGRDGISGEIHLGVESYLGSEVSSQTVQDATFRLNLLSLDFIEFMLTKLADVRHARLHQLWIQSHVCTSTPLFTATTNWSLPYQTR